MHSNFIIFCLITPFMPHLNSSINSLPLYSLSFITLLNFCTNSSIILLPYSTFFSSATLIVSSSPLPNSCFKSVKNFPLLQIPIFYSLDPLLHSISIYLPILPVHMTTPTIPASLLPSPLFSFLYRTCMLSKILTPCLQSY